MKIEAEIVVAGNEILLGDVLDTNSHWLCGELTEMGIVVRRVCQVRDDLSAIEGAIRSALSRGADVIITTGGLGPTADDVTLEALAQALGGELAVHPLALQWVVEKYRDLAAKGYVDSPEMTPERRKMARLPAGAQPLRNEEGAAPGVLIRRGDGIIISLPGVPEELKGIFARGVRPVLSVLAGKGVFLEWHATVDCGDESVLAPLLATVNEKWPGVYVKSRARRFGPDGEFLVTLSASGHDQEGAAALLESAWQDLEGALGDKGIDVLDLERS
ncbi:MAG: molybdopterin-binding protein [Chloroflexota bacterium]|nr:molybdopterin-binding protein [Chloroflexota bacterium]